MGKRRSQHTKRRGSPLITEKQVPETPRKAHQHWRKSLAWSSGVATAVLIGVLISVLSSQANRIVPAPVSGSAMATYSQTASALPSAEHQSPVSPRSSSSAPQSLQPLTVVSEDPLNVDDINDWIFPDPLILNAAELHALNADFLRNPIGNAAADYLSSRGGYEMNDTDTQLVVQNNLGIPVRILILT